MTETAELVRQVPLKDIWVDHDFNCRTTGGGGAVNWASVASLADSIRREGLMQPIVIQPMVNPALGTKYKVVMGHRRYAAHQLLTRDDPVKWGTIKSIVLDRPLPEHEALIMNLKENMEREPLNMLQEARGIAQFKKWGWDPRRVAAELGKTRKWVEVRFGLLSLPDTIQRRAEAGTLTQYQVEECLKLPTAEEQYDYVRRVVDARERVDEVDPDAPAKVRKRTAIQVMSEGVTRTPAEMWLLQESIQDSFKDNKHPAAVALAWAAGIISYDAFVKQIQQWAADDGVTYVEHEEIVKRAG